VENSKLLDKDLRELIFSELESRIEDKADDIWSLEQDRTKLAEILGSVKVYSLSLSTAFYDKVHARAALVEIRELLKKDPQAKVQREKVLASLSEIGLPEPSRIVKKILKTGRITEDEDGYIEGSIGFLQGY